MAMHDVDMFCEVCYFWDIISVLASNIDCYINDLMTK